MATIKSYTSVEQSRKLAEILPLESADMCWTNHCYGSIRSSITISAKPIDKYKNLLERFADLTEIDVFYPAWSLSALLDIMPKVESVGYEQYPILEHDDEGYEISSPIHNTDYYDNPIDACYEMIIKLHELNLL